MVVSESNHVTWLRLQDAPYKAWAYDYEVPSEFQNKAVKYTFGDKAGAKAGTSEYRVYFDLMNVVFTGVVLDVVKKEVSGKQMEFKNIVFDMLDGSDMVKLTVSFDYKGRELFYRLWSIAQTNRVFSLKFNVRVQNESLMGSFMEVLGENGVETNPIHLGCINKNRMWIPNPLVQDVFVETWNKACDYIYSEKAAADKAKDSFFIFKGNDNKELTNAYILKLDALVEQHIPLLNEIFRKNLPNQNALPPATPVVAAIAEGAPTQGFTETEKTGFIKNLMAAIKESKESAEITKTVIMQAYERKGVDATKFVAYADAEIAKAYPQKNIMDLDDSNEHPF